MQDPNTSSTGVDINFKVFLASEKRDLIYCRMAGTGHKLQSLSATARLVSELVSFNSRSVLLQKVSDEPGKAKSAPWVGTAQQTLRHLFTTPSFSLPLSDMGGPRRRSRDGARGSGL